jgi:hypothetical protein
MLFQAIFHPTQPVRIESARLFRGWKKLVHCSRAERRREVTLSAKPSCRLVIAICLLKKTKRPAPNQICCVALRSERLLEDLTTQNLNKFRRPPRERDRVFVFGVRRKMTAWLHKNSHHGTNSRSYLAGDPPKTSFGQTISRPSMPYNSKVITALGDKTPRCPSLAANSKTAVVVSRISRT